MTAKFDVKMQARSLSKLMAMAEASMAKAGGALHTERLIDYTSNEFGRLSIKQCLEVLALIDKDYEKKLFRDGYGEVIGYAHSRRIFIILRRDQSQGNNNEEFAKLFVKKVKARRG
jgi:hypothetical protein